MKKNKIYIDNEYICIHHFMTTAGVTHISYHVQGCIQADMNASEALKILVCICIYVCIYDYVMPTTNYLFVAPNSSTRPTLLLL
jgi:hypothetical protein